MSISSPAQGMRSPALAKPKRRRWLKVLALVVICLVVAAGTGVYGFARRSLPQVTGELRLPGLTAPVTVYRDQWGVPHIEAQNTHDLYMAQGYITAQDRLWQMDLSRRAAGGQLGEIFGESYVETDKFFRTIMLRRSAERSLSALSPWTMEVLNAYSAGVNAFIADARGRLPIEFALLGYEPAPWTPVDSVSIGKFMAWDLSGDQLRAEVFRYQVRQTAGDAMARQLFPSYPEDGITIMRHAAEGTPSNPVATAEMPPDDSHIDMSALLALNVFPDPGNGSNNWVVSGKLTASGKPLLANDPHLGIRTPAIWYQTHLRVTGEKEKQNVIGVTFPGAPGVVVGRNETIAWGVTNTDPDVGDLYIERRNPANPYQFEYQGKWEDAAVHKETIKVKGKPDVPYEVVVTRHGPIISEVTGSAANRPKDALAFRWTAHLATPELEAILLFDKASNWTEFRDALRSFLVPTQNFVFASVDGTIAYRPAGRIPIRAQGDGLLPVPGWTDTHEWKSYIPFDQLPEVVNPPEGFIATANNKVVDDSYPFFITSNWALPYRAQRITDVLRSKTGFTVDDMRKLQVDYTDLQARTLLPLLLPSVEKADLDETGRAALAALKSWDYVDNGDKAAPLVFHVWWERLRQQLFEPTMGKDLYSRLPGRNSLADATVRQAAKGAPNDWVKAVGGLDKLAVASFQQAVAEIVPSQGKDVQKWEWGRFHRFGPQHPIGGSVAALGWFLNPKPQPVSGSRNTVAQMSFDGNTGLVDTAAVWRQVVDLADPQGNSFDVVTPGQSGHFLSPWYKDQAPLHLKGELHPQTTKPEAYQKGKRLTLKP